MVVATASVREDIDAAMDNDGQLLGRMEQGISDLWASPAARGDGGGDDEAFTIVRLPSHVHAQNKSLYEPRVVSVGPYDLGSGSTRAMQGHKWRFLRDFLLQNAGDGGGGGGGGGHLDACLREARAVEARARRCYGEPLEMGSDEFVQMVVLDGCFVLEFLLKWSESESGAAELDAYIRWIWIYVYYDLLLVENQIPFFVVAKLFNLAGGGGGAAAMGDDDDDAVDQRLLDLIYKFFSLHEPLCQVPAPSQLTTTGDWEGEGIVTSYLVLMNALVNTGADVAVLQRRGVLDNMLSNEEAAAAFFNRFGGCALFDPRGHHYARLFADANEYRNHRWNRYIAVLKRDHLRTPCSIISLLAAATLLCISVMSAGFIICHYRHACS
ncbi:Os09g0540300 [Oryza sativa Japonica Group]|uniref:Os09g0540300 protein n=1 Tax=Oryza sativa subsp. japonica TaxID=39947 RepID=A0A0P0XPY3_ORYSJ|nr:hypothetical protein EE612_049220 [Oryza sativa]BAT09191.1 Os09g0540300 [Oryza sativa Japonica Group]